MIQEYLRVPASTLIEAANQTIYMVAVSLVAGAILGMLIAIVLVLTRERGPLENKWVFNILGAIVNIVRSIPFIIFIVAVMPLTKFIVGTRIGTTAAIIPLVLHVAPYLARLFESSLLEVQGGIIEAAQSMGATTWQIIRYFLLPEAMPSLMLAITTGTIGLLGSTAMAGAIGAGGVGNLALTYGYERLNMPLMAVTVIILIILVQIIQSLGNYLAQRFRHV
ncbi:methionine ABC transporter permease [uncultured Phascolarctobacterium sp.]|uniref:methionine ABC transporter permease n=1 Tax=uncultured Phascolarctobacterium sp. TaxID=512296 RepID=UPI0025CE3BDD|nr:methionine ABC transporter permease [uncultured Phascolarctobacterium sp.]